jgi:hypothetical protein
VRINEELLERKVAGINDRGGSTALTMRHPSIHKSWHYFSPMGGSHSVSIVHLWTKGTEFVCNQMVKVLLQQAVGPHRGV